MKIMVKLKLSVLTICILVLSACIQKEAIYEIDEGAYSFDPTTILEQLDSNQGLQAETSRPTPRPAPEPIRWREEDFFRVASKVLPPAWETSLLQRITFYLPCRDVQAGPQGMIITFYKMNREVRSELLINISARDGYILWLQTDYHPTQHARPVYRSLELSKFKVHLLDALKLTEESGGKDYRLQMENNCDIEGMLMFDSWTVWYVRPNATPGYKVEINAWTGQVDVVSGQQ